MLRPNAKTHGPTNTSFFLCVLKGYSDVLRT